MISILTGLALLAGEANPKNVEKLVEDPVPQGSLVTATSSRPLLQIIGLLSKKTGLEISYEDPNFEDSEAFDVTVEEWRRTHPGRVGLVIPKIRSVQVVVPESTRSLSDVTKVLEQAVAKLNVQDVSYRFTVLKKQSQQLALVGKSLTQTMPIGDTLVERPTASSAGDLELRRLIDVCSLKAGFPIVVAQAPWRLLETISVPKASGQFTCREGIENLIDKLPVRSRYVFTHGFDSNNFVLTFIPIYRAVTDVNGKTTLEQVR